jgi:hypothetical protein
LKIEQKCEKKKAFAKEKGLKYFEVSAKTGQNINEAFFTLAEDVLKEIDPSCCLPPSLPSIEFLQLMSEIDNFTILLKPSKFSKCHIQ